jgi:L-ribulose-5-phosphate 3-epimerase
MPDLRSAQAPVKQVARLGNAGRWAGAHHHGPHVLGDNQDMPTTLTRRTLLSAAAAGLATARESKPVKLVIFSKHLHWAKWNEMAAVALECGFDGIDLTVRKGGHVLPERVAEDLPRAAEAIKKAGSELSMITAGIVDAQSPFAEAILKAASGVGVRHYRWGGFRYDDRVPVPQQLATLKQRVAQLAELNRRYNMTAMYHTHSGMDFGAPIWDLWALLRDFDSNLAGINYDIGHATIEGGYGGWIRSAQVTAPMMRGVAVKDFRWARNNKGEWRPEWCAPGEGMVQFTRFFTMLKEQRFAGPIQVHLEYSGLGGAEHGATELGIPKHVFMHTLRRDAEFYRARMREAGLG